MHAYCYCLDQLQTFYYLQIIYRAFVIISCSNMYRLLTAHIGLQLLFFTVPYYFYLYKNLINTYIYFKSTRGLSIVHFSINS